MNTRLALISGTVVLMLIGNLAVMADRSQRDFKTESAVANTVTDKVTDKVTNTVTNEAVNNTAIVTETEVYKVVCVESADTFCKEYSVRKINRE